VSDDDARAWLSIAGQEDEERLDEAAKGRQAAAALDAGLAEAQRKVEDEFALDPDLPEGVSVRFDNRPLEPDDTEIFGRRCPEAVDDSLDENPP
jgi:hypothetical protein